MHVTLSRILTRTQEYMRSQKVLFSLDIILNFPKHQQNLISRWVFFSHLISGWMRFRQPPRCRTNTLCHELVFPTTKRCKRWNIHSLLGKIISRWWRWFNRGLSSRWYLFIYKIIHVLTLFRSVMIQCNIEYKSNFQLFFAVFVLLLICL